MTEALFQFIWQYSLFNAGGMVTTDGDAVTVVHPGKLNRDAGPDFLEARVKIGNALLVGNVEMHLKSSDWQKHGHGGDKAYQNLVLHVVYENDRNVEIPGVPTVILYSHIDANLFNRYEALMQAKGKLPCAGQLEHVRPITRESWLTRLLAERWEEKLGDWNIMLENSAEDWRNLFYWRMAANFGFKTNAVAFQLLARSIPLNILGRHRDNLHQVEALLFGQAGMLDADFDDAYPEELKREYEYLRRKYSLRPMSGHLWKFLRMRPVNFPTIRISQFAALIHKSEHLFSRMMECHSFKEIEPLLDVAASEYWNSHFVFGELHTGPGVKALGRSSIENIVINTIAPVQFLFASKQGNDDLKEKALNLLEAVKAEKNNILTIWNEHGWQAGSAAQSQALIQLYNRYCSERKCLHCMVGLNILKQATEK